MNDILIIGHGFLGKAILGNAKKIGMSCTCASLNPKNREILKIDITNSDSINEIIMVVKPKCIINCAANVNLDFLEKNPKIAFSVNSHGPQKLAQISKNNKIKFIHISTDGVFAGEKENYEEGSLPNPINIYAKSKALGEKLVMDEYPESIIVRTNFFGFDIDRKFLFNWVLNQLEKKLLITGFNDVIFTPLEIQNLSKMIIELTTINFNGIIHLASDEKISKYEFATKIAEIFNLDKKLIVKGSIEDMKMIAKRPKNTSLLNKKSKLILKTKVCSIKSSLIRIKRDIESK